MATIEIHGITYERVTDLRTLNEGDKLRQHHENHMVSHLTVVKPYGHHLSGEGVVCRTYEEEDTWLETLTPLSAETDPVWRAL
jgi:hypothetical protein